MHLSASDEEQYMSRDAPLEVPPEPPPFVEDAPPPLPPAAAVPVLSSEDEHAPEARPTLMRRMNGRAEVNRIEESL
jgi:hypothetical protein